MRTRMRRAVLVALVVLLGGAMSAANAATISVTGNITTSTTWTADNEYVLTQVIYVTNGATLTIEAGTVVRGQPESSSGSNDPGTLVIARGAKLNADAAESMPIVFTDEFDDNIGSNPGSPPYDDKSSASGLTGLWGGVIMLGTGYVANNTAAGPDPARENQIEGLTPAGGLGNYGGCSSFLAGPYGRNCDDGDSGILRYASIRYGGFNLSAANEINGLTLGGVGRSTTFDYIEIFQNQDDGVEFFGGAPYVKHLVVFGVGDDSIDYDEGFRGRVQYGFVVQGPAPFSVNLGDKGGEHDGGISPDGSRPFAIPTLYNVTSIGMGGVKNYAGRTANTAINFRDNAGGRYYNSFFADWGGAAAIIEGGAATGSDPLTSGERSETAYAADGVYYLDPTGGRELELADNSYWCLGNGSTIPTGDCTAFGGGNGKVCHDPGVFSSFNNVYEACGDPLPIRDLTRGIEGDPTLPDPLDTIDPRPLPGSSLLTGYRPTPVDAFFDNAAYKGAFGPNENWARNWSTMDRLGYFSEVTTVTVTDNITESQTWSSTTEYVLDKVIYVTDGATLTIEPGTVVRGQPESSSGANDPGALVIARGAKLQASGDVLAPIVFTDEFDDNIGANPGSPPYDDQASASGLTGLWGGVIILGTGYVANNTAAGPNPARENQIEGLTPTGGLGNYGGCSSFLAGPYGRNCDDGDSGTLRYASIRYGGFNLSAANEINGLTLGGVGRSTTLDYIEIFQNQDDGVEFFGGAAGIKHLAIFGVGDDSIDYDEGWRGKIQYGFVLQGPSPFGINFGDKGGEHDGGISPDGSRPFAIPTLYNVTSIGQGGVKNYAGRSANTAINFRDNAGGRYYNSFFADWGGAAAIIEGGPATGTDPLTSGERSETAYAADGVYYLDPTGGRELELANNDYWCLGNGAAIPTGDCTAFGGGNGKVCHDPGVFGSFGNSYASCGAALPIRDLTRQDSGDPTLPNYLTRVDPRPAPGSSLLSGYTSTPVDGFFDDAPYQGAFAPGENWAAGWSTLARLSYFPTNPQVVVSSNITTSQTWSADTEYVLDNVVYVTNGATLTIEPCTVVRGRPESSGGANDPGTLVISRDGRLDAAGTADCPIVFTDEFDDNFGGSTGTIPYNDKEFASALTGQWGGVIMLGTGYVANNTAGGPDPARENQIEGLTPAGGLGNYGGCSSFLAGPYGRNCDDGDSGNLQFASIRYGGFNLSAANEINGLTLGGVGRNTDLDYIEIFQNQDDGVEFFGGAAGIDHLVVFGVGDDSIDYDEGYRGQIQFALVVQGPAPFGVNLGDKGGEHDGGISPDGSQPFAIPTLYNVTSIGMGGKKNYAGRTANTAINFRDNAGGRYYNSFFADWGGAAAIIEGGSATGTDPLTSGERSESVYTIDDAYYLDSGAGRELELADNHYWCLGNGPVIPTGDCTAFGGGGGKVCHDPGIFSNPTFDNSYTSCGGLAPANMPIRRLDRGDAGDPTLPDPLLALDPRPAAGSTLNQTTRRAPSRAGFQNAPFKGAFRYGDNWAAGWSTMYRLRYFPTCDGGANPEATPNEVPILRFDSLSDLSWDAPFGDDLTGYDVVRSFDPADFSAATCIESGDGDNRAIDTTTPVLGAPLYYVVRPNNDCGAGSSGLGFDGTERVVGTCP